MQTLPKSLVYNATLVHRGDLTDLLGIFRVQPDPQDGVASPSESTVPVFAAGQYAVLGANNELQPEKGAIRRAYSIGSPPYEQRWLEFYVRYVDQPTSPNPFTHLLWQMGEGSRLWLGPKITGRFTMRDTLEPEDTRLRLFVAAGTGLAPFVSMVMQADRDGEFGAGEPPNCALLHGASHPSDLGYQSDLEALMNRVEQRYFPSISRPHLHPEWQGDTGRVEDYFTSGKLAELESRLGREPGFISPENCAVYVCGLQGTIAETVKRLLPRGFVPDNRRIREALKLPAKLPPTLFFEQYDTTPILDLHDRELMASLQASYLSSASS
ncbi:MAG: hypothetical protein V3U35_05780 [Candidatus Neomarinimicrobiota bacterium]